MTQEETSRIVLKWQALFDEQTVLIETQSDLIKTLLEANDRLLKLILTQDTNGK